MAEPSKSQTRSDGALRPGLTTEQLQNRIVAHCRAAAAVRRGICLLNAGQFDEAANAFREAERLGSTDASLPAYLAACLIGQEKAEAAADKFAELIDAGTDPSPIASQIRRALALWSGGNVVAAVEALRAAVHVNPECAELHFQLGTLLTSLEKYEEAELRFTQALTIDRDHTEAMVDLALCCGARGAPGEAVTHLQRAQARRPNDARIGLLLAQAAQAVRQQGLPVRVRARMADVDTADGRHGIDELSHLIAAEPDFVDAFLCVPVGEVDERVFATLLRTLEVALERQPEHAELHFHCGRLLERLGRRDDAIAENERAVQLDPTFTRALIELGKLYQATDRSAAAAARLEQAVHNGAEYADVYFLLGNLYRDAGQVSRARSAYRRALALNDHYEAAQAALASLPA